MATLEELKAMGFEVITLDIGDRVVCDGCNEEYTNSEEKGGILLNRTAYCPACAPRVIAGAKKYGEEMYLAYPDPGLSFRDFVHKMRKLRKE